MSWHNKGSHMTVNRRHMYSRKMCCRTLRGKHKICIGVTSSMQHVMVRIYIASSVVESGTYIIQSKLANCHYEESKPLRRKDLSSCRI
jgi:hypothetical protein